MSDSQAALADEFGFTDENLRLASQLHHEAFERGRAYRVSSCETPAR